MHYAPDAVKGRAGDEVCPVNVIPLLNMIRHAEEIRIERVKQHGADTIGQYVMFGINLALTFLVGAAPCVA
jgi:hypothetical protein